MSLGNGEYMLNGGQSARDTHRWRLATSPFPTFQRVMYVVYSGLNIHNIAVNLGNVATNIVDGSMYILRWRGR